MPDHIIRRGDGHRVSLKANMSARRSTARVTDAVRGFLDARAHYRYILSPLLGKRAARDSVHT